MKINHQSHVWDIHNCLIITFILLLIVKLDIFGIPGLFIYGFIFIYPIACMIINKKPNLFCKSITFYSGIIYYIAALIAPIINGGFNRIGTYIAQLFVFMLMAFTNRKDSELEKDIDSLAKIMLIAGFIMCTGSIFLSILVTFYPEFTKNLPSVIYDYVMQHSSSFSDRIIGLTDNPNTTACYCYVGASFSIYMLFNNPNKTWKGLSIANICLSAYIIFIATASRTTMLSFLSFSIVFIVSYYLVIHKNTLEYRKIFKKFLVISLLFVFLLIILLITVPDFRRFILNNVIRISSLSDGSNRLTVYKTAWEYGKGKRLLGFSSREFYDQTSFSHTHNALLEVLSFAGLIGFVPFLIFAFSSIYFAIENLRQCNTLISDDKFKTVICFFMAFIVGYIFNAMTENGSVNRLVPISVVLQLVIGYTSQIYYGHIKIAKSERLIH